MVTRLLLTGALVAAALADVFVPAQAIRDFGAPMTMAAHFVQPKPELLALYERLPQGPVLDVPFDYSAAGILNYMPQGVLSYMPHYVFLSAYHARPIGGCYNSFVVRVQEDLAGLVSQLPDRAAVDALAGLGFRSLVVHDEFVVHHFARLERLAGFVVGLHPLDPELTHLTFLGRGANHTTYVLDHPVTTTTSDTALAIGETPALGTETPLRVTAHSPQVDLLFGFRNGAAEVYHHPQPIEPSWLRLRWYSTAGALVHEDRVREMLPLALAPGQTMIRKITVPIGVAPGEYQLTLSRDTAPSIVLSRQRLSIVPAARS
jgi:hypothetical protein